MNKYDRDMMHERELIYDAKKQKEYHPGDTSNDDKLIYDAKHRKAAYFHKSFSHKPSCRKSIGTHFDSSTDRGISTLYTAKRKGE